MELTLSTRLRSPPHQINNKVRIRLEPFFLPTSSGEELEEPRDGGGVAGDGCFVELRLEYGEEVPPGVGEGFGGREVGVCCWLWHRVQRLLKERVIRGCARTTVDSAKGPEMMSSGTDMALAQCRVAASQSCASIASCNDDSDAFP